MTLMSASAPGARPGHGGLEKPRARLRGLRGTDDDLAAFLELLSRHFGLLTVADAGAHALRFENALLVQIPESAGVLRPAAAATQTAARARRLRRAISHRRTRSRKSLAARLLGLFARFV